MKVRVMYTVEYTEDDLMALGESEGVKRMKRDDLRSMLEDIGTMGISELIAHHRPADLHRDDPEE